MFLPACEAPMAHLLRSYHRLLCAVLSRTTPDGSKDTVCFAGGSPV